MIIQYKGTSCISLTEGKEYEVLTVEHGWFRIMDDTNEDYLFSPDEFEIIKE